MCGWLVITHRTTVTHCLTTVIRSEKWVVRRFNHCANVIECTYTNIETWHWLGLVTDESPFRHPYWRFALASNFPPQSAYLEFPKSLPLLIESRSAAHECNIKFPICSYCRTYCAAHTHYWKSPASMFKNLQSYREQSRSAYNPLDVLWRIYS